MIRIGICEDDDRQAEHIRELTERTLLRRTEYRITRYASGEELIDAMEDGDSCIDLLLLDIHLAQMDGLSAADYIRKHTMDVDIIFVTVSGKYVYRGYQYKAFSYVLKSEIERTLSEELNRYMDEWERVDLCLEIPISGSIVKLPIGKIYYLESKARKVIAHMAGEDVEFYSRLDELEEMLSGTGFFRCHQSYLFNSLFLEGISRETVVIHKTPLPVSRKYYERFKAEGRFYTDDSKKNLKEGAERDGEK